MALELQGQQSKMANKMETGAFFAIKHLRLIERVTGVGKVVGRIGGPDRLIHKLNTNNTNEELERLLECVWSMIFIWSLGCIYLPCRITDGGNNGKKHQLQGGLKTSLRLPEF